MPESTSKADGADDDAVRLAADHPGHKFPRVAVSQQRNQISPVVGDGVHLLDQVAKMLVGNPVGNKKNVIAALALERPGDGAGVVVELPDRAQNPLALILRDIPVVVEHIGNNGFRYARPLGHLLAGDTLLAHAAIPSSVRFLGGTLLLCILYDTPLPASRMDDKVSRAFKSLLTKKGKDAYTVDVGYTRVYIPCREENQNCCFRRIFPWRGRILNKAIVLEK